MARPPGNTSAADGENLRFSSRLALAPATTREHKPGMNANDAPWPFLVGGLLLALASLWASLHLRRQQRLLRDLPTSKASGVFIGLVELKGTTESALPLTSFLAEAACVQFAWRVEEHWSRLVTETYTDDKGRTQTRLREESGWTTVAEGGETQDFYAQDDTGAVLVRPDGAKLEPQSFFDETVSRGDPLYYAKGPEEAVANSDHRRRFSETGLPLHAPLYIVGTARERADIVAPELAASQDGAMFLISTRTEEKVEAGFAGWSWFWWALGLLLACGPIIFAIANNSNASFRASLPLPPALLVAPPLAYLFLWALGWVWMVFNSLVGLRNRVRSGWSLIDVQLNRRHDLIPGLVAVVSSLAGHEQDTQTALAALRAQATATPPGASGADYGGLAATLRFVVEKYPSLTAQESFARLHRALVETEQRVALARTYYNDIATHFATRLEQVPDCWVAKLGALRPEPLLSAENFERASVSVKFAE